ncbi:hypothetical protein EMCRGX_G009665 [Ephydatia muelleri]
MFSPRVLHSNGKVPSVFSLPLQPNQHFNITIIAYNSYENVSFNTSVSTHSVIAVNFSTTAGTEFTCIFNSGSHAIGCLMHLTYIANGFTYYIALQRLSNVTESNLSVFRSSNATLGAGTYLLKAYDIENDGSISKLPAVITYVLLETHAKLVIEPSFSPTIYSPEYIESQYNMQVVVIGISSSVPAFFIILVAAALCICALCKKKDRIAIAKREAKRMTKISNMCASKPTSTSIPDGGQISLECCVAYNDGSSEPIKLSQNDFEHYKVVFTDILVSINQLKMEPKPIGEGAFGIVYGATIHSGWEHEAVAVKTVKELYSRSDVEQFFEECCRMKAFKHPNVVELIGMCLDSPDGFPLMILPLYPNGNLKLYLQEKRKFTPFVTTLPEGLSTPILFGMCLDIAQGMKYLTGKGFVHRDLAARNCMWAL